MKTPEMAALRSVIDRLSKESDSWHAIAMDTQAETERLTQELTGVRESLANESAARDDWEATANMCRANLKVSRALTAFVKEQRDNAWAELDQVRTPSDEIPRTHDGIRVDKAIKPRSGQ